MFGMKSQSLKGCLWWQWLICKKLWIKLRYLRSDCSGVRTRTVTLVESDWPMVSVTVNWNLYIPDVRLDTIIWSLKPVFYMKTKNKNWLPFGRITFWELNSQLTLPHLYHSIGILGKHLPQIGHNRFVVFALQAVQRHAVLRLDHAVLASIGHWWTVGFFWSETPW